MYDAGVESLPLVRLFVGPLLLVGLTTLGAVLARPGRIVLPLVCSVSGGLAVFLLPSPVPLFAEVLGLLAFGFNMRMLDVVRRRDPDVWARLILAMLVYDPAGIRPSRPRLDVATLIAGFGFGVLAIASLVLGAYTRGLVRTVAGMVFFYAFLAGPDAFAHTVFAAIGLDLPRLQRSPVRARSATELWGRRWNREVGSWLERWCFRPLSRRGHPVLGVAAAFGFSALLHAVPTWAVVGPAYGLQMGAFFLVHGVIVLVEARLGVTRWRPVFAHAWTLVMFVGTAPLFVEPGFAVFGV